MCPVYTNIYIYINMAAVPEGNDPLLNVIWCRDTLKGHPNPVLTRNIKYVLSHDACKNFCIFFFFYNSTERLFHCDRDNLVARYLNNCYMNSQKLKEFLWKFVYVYVQYKVTYSLYTFKTLKLFFSVGYFLRRV